MINFSLVSNICEVVPISLFWALNGLDELPEIRFVFPFNLTDKLTIYGIFNRPIMAHTQILVHSWETQDKDFDVVSQMKLTRV